MLSAFRAFLCGLGNRDRQPSCPLAKSPQAEMGRWDRQPDSPLPSAAAQAGFRLSARRYPMYASALKSPYPLYERGSSICLPGRKIPPSRRETSRGVEFAPVFPDGYRISGLRAFVWQTFPLCSHNKLTPQTQNDLIVFYSATIGNIFKKLKHIQIDLSESVCS
jgi:hypothetical protein